VTDAFAEVRAAAGFLTRLPVRGVGDHAGAGAFGIEWRPSVSCVTFRVATSIRKISLWIPMLTTARIDRPSGAQVARSNSYAKSGKSAVGVPPDAGTMNRFWL